MRLSPELFEKMTGCRPSPTEPSPRAVRQERRVDARIPFNGKAALLDGRRGRGRLGETPVRDISPGGVALLHDVPLPPDSLFVVLLETRQHELYPFRCRVMRCARVTDTCYSIGAAFEQALPAPTPRPAPAAAPAAPSPPPRAPRPTHPAPRKPMDEVERLRRAVLS